jgi:cell division protein FtsN
LPPARDPAAILSGAASPAPTAASAARSTAGAAEAFVYFVQAGAYTRTEDAEQQRAKLAMIGVESKVTEREQAGRTVYRVRVGPHDTRDEADALQVRLTNIGIEARLVRVERP